MSVIFATVNIEYHTNCTTYNIFVKLGCMPCNFNVINYLINVLKIIIF